MDDWIAAPDKERRGFLKALGAVGKTALPAVLFGCASRRRSGRVRNGGDRRETDVRKSGGQGSARKKGRGTAANITVDPTFAQRFVAYCDQSNTEDKRKLLVHPALGAIVRHRSMTTGRRPTRNALLAQLLGSCAQADGARRVLGEWQNSSDAERRDLVLAAAEALRYLPPETTFAGKLFLVVNYDIGIPAPPDAALNVGHPHFVQNSDELAPYATHEFHHVGFLAERPFPALKGMHRREKLLSLINYFTQLEGMAVHAAFFLRRRCGWLANERDYRVYTDPAFAQKIAAKYGEVYMRVQSRATHSTKEVEEVLTKFSSGERLWYRMGALTAWSLEKKHGRKKLVDTIRHPALFRQTLGRLTGQKEQPRPS